MFRCVQLAAYTPHQYMHVCWVCIRYLAVCNAAVVCGGAHPSIAPYPRPRQTANPKHPDKPRFHSHAHSRAHLFADLDLCGAHLVPNNAFLTTLLSLAHVLLVQYPPVELSRSEPLLVFACLSSDSFADNAPVSHIPSTHLCTHIHHYSYICMPVYLCCCHVYAMRRGCGLAIGEYMDGNADGGVCFVCPWFSCRFFAHAATADSK